MSSHCLVGIIVAVARVVTAVRGRGLKERGGLAWWLPYDARVEGKRRASRRRRVSSPVSRQCYCHGGGCHMQGPRGCYGRNWVTRVVAAVIRMV